MGPASCANVRVSRAGRRIPDSDEWILITGRCECEAIRGERDSPHTIAVSLETDAFLARRDVPNLNQAAATADDQCGTVWRVGDALRDNFPRGYGLLDCREFCGRLAGGQVPEPNGSVGASGCNRSVIGRERDAGDPACMAQLRGP